MSYSTVLRFNRAYKFFWQSLEEFCDLSLRDRADLVYLCDQVLDEEARVPLGRRALTMALGGSSGADEVIDFCRRCPFVCVYVGPDGKEYAAVPALPLLATDKQRKTMQQSACPPPPADYEDAAVRHARMLRRNGDDGGDNETLGASKPSDTPSKRGNKSSVGASKSDVGASKPTLTPDELGNKQSLTASKPTLTPSHAHAITRDRAHACARETQPNPTQPNGVGALQAPHSREPSPPGSTDARAIGSPVAVASPPALGGAGEATPGERDPPTKRTREPLTREEEAERVRELRRQLAAMEAS